MFGNIKEQVKEAQSEVKADLEQMKIAKTSDNEDVSVIVNGNRKIVDIQISADLLNTADPENLQQIIKATANKALDEAEQHAEKAMMDAAKRALPNLGALFG
ncbi:MAG: YbaB/EbfC family nucleoid-associated protein [Bacteroidales bacterium]